MIRVALVCDPREEKWPSMDLVADMLYRCLKDGHSDLKVEELRLPMSGPLSANGASAGYHVRSAERLLHRFVRYPKWLRRRARDFDIFHVLDHSYAQLIHEIPPDRAVVSCHDLDAFRCVLDPQREKRSVPFRLMTKRVLKGLTRASRILCDSQAVHDEFIQHGLVPAARVSVVLHGTHPACTPSPHQESDSEVARLLGLQDNSRYLLHVGSTIARKRIDVLLHVFAAAKKSDPNLELVRVGGPFTPAQEELARQLGVRDSIRILPHISRHVLAAVYRRAAFLLLTSDAEGFGLPLVEAMACGCPVLASDLPVLREIGGDAAIFCPVADIEAWTKTTRDLLSQQKQNPDGWAKLRDSGLLNASRFTWERSAAQCADVYKSVYKSRRLNN
jgi:glycosyltransferase involved in cell wall biosynthesis